MPSFKPTLKGFRSWFSRRSPNAIIGVSGDHCWCPLAEWIRDATSFDVEVHVGWIKVFCVPQQVHATPDWAKQFMRLVDGGTKPFTGISARRALAALEECAA